MTDRECMECCIKALERIKVPVDLLEEIGIPLCAMRNTLIRQIQQMDMEANKNKEGKKDADDTVQRAETEPEHAQHRA